MKNYLLAATIVSLMACKMPLRPTYSEVRSIKVPTLESVKQAFPKAERVIVSYSEQGATDPSATDVEKVEWAEVTDADTVTIKNGVYYFFKAQILNDKNGVLAQSAAKLKDSSCPIALLDTVATEVSLSVCDADGKPAKISGERDVSVIIKPASGGEVPTDSTAGRLVTLKVAAELYESTNNFNTFCKFNAVPSKIYMAEDPNKLVADSNGNITVTLIAARGTDKESQVGVCDITSSQRAAGKYGAKPGDTKIIKDLAGKFLIKKANLSL